MVRNALINNNKKVNFCLRVVSTKLKPTKGTIRMFRTINLSDKKRRKVKPKAIDGEDVTVLQNHDQRKFVT